MLQTLTSRFAALLTAAILCVTGASAEDSHLRLHIDFANADGRYVSDTETESGVRAQVMSTATIEQMGDYSILNLGNGTGYLDLKVATGKLVRQLEDYTVSVYYRVNESASLSGAGYFLWSFSQLSVNSETSGPYLGYRLNAQKMCASAAGWGSETGPEVGSASQQGRWVHFLYRQQGTLGQLYLNGRQVASASAMPVPKEMFKSNPSYCWIGRPAFSGDSYLKQTLVYDFRLYDEALSNAEISELAAVADDLEQTYRYGTPGDVTALAAKLAEAQAFLATAEGYAPEALGELRDEVHLAAIEVEAARATQTLLDLRLKNLTTALTAAKKTAGFALAPTRTFNPNGHGFRHPGGVVTEADFVRIRAALAAGDSRITRAYEILCQNAYSQSDVLTWPVETIVRGGGSGQNYMNVARGAAMAFQNALRWKISGSEAHAANGVTILMNWARNNKYVSGDTNLSLAAGIYGYELAQAAELLRDYDGWSREEFEEFKRYMLVTWYPVATDFLRRRHDTWANFRYANLGERPGHYWSNWGLCNALCLMSIGILCDDVHIYNQGVSFYKYDHVGTFKDRSALAQILNDGCNEFIGNLVPVVLPDARGPLGYLGQMQESGRDQGHALMALGLAVDICQTGLGQGDDLFAYMDDRIAAGAEFVAASNFGGVDAASLPWKNYDYADCRGTMGAAWLMTGVNTGGAGEWRPYWDRLIGYYEGQRGVKMQYSEAASAAICPDGGGGNYSQNSGGFDHIGFSTLTAWRPAIDAAEAITPLTGDIVYKGETLKNQTNLGGLKYTYVVDGTHAIPADGADITLVPQLPEGVEDTEQWQWETGETTRQLTVQATDSRIYRVRYTAQNGAVSEAAFAIAVAGDAVPDYTTEEITVDGVIRRDTVQTVLYGKSVILYVGNSTGWTNDYRWSNGVTANSVIVIPNLTEDRTYTCQYVNQGGYVNERHFHLHVVPAIPFTIVSGAEVEDTELTVFEGTQVTLGLTLPDIADPADVTWQDGSHGRTFSLTVPSVHSSGVLAADSPLTYTATYAGRTYTWRLTVKTADFSYARDLLTAERGYTRIDSETQLQEAIARGDRFVLASDDADLLVGLRDAAPMNGNRALFYETPADPIENLNLLFALETFEGGYCMRNVDYDGLLLQTEWDAPHNWRTHDQPYGIIWAKFLLQQTGGAWTIENGTYTGNWLGLWTPANGYRAGEELACNKTGADVAHFQLYALPRARFHQEFLSASLSSPSGEVGRGAATPLIFNPAFTGNSWVGWTVTGTWGNQRFNGAAEVWHSTNFEMSQTLYDLPAGRYTVSCQLVNGEGRNTGYLYATASGETAKAEVTQSCAGSNFDAERDRMAANADYARLSVDATVGDDGTLRFGLKEPTAGTTWLVWDDFRLTYHGATPDGIKEIENGQWIMDNEAGSVYDLSGRKMSNSLLLHRGVYVSGGRKVVVK